MVWMKRESLKMQEADWERFKKLAVDTQSIYSGEPSWRRLMMRVARGEFKLTPNEPTHVDLCAGIGGFSIAAERAGFRTIAHAETDPFCSRVLRKHWPTIVNLGNLESVQLPERYATLLTAGWPCQDISIAGTGAGLAGARSGLWRHVFRIVDESRPLVCVFEQSPMLRSRGYATVSMDLERIGYRVRPFVVDARLFGANQGRVRAYLVAYAVQDRDERHVQGVNFIRDGQRWAGGQEGLCDEGWRTRALFGRGGESEPILCRADDGIPNRLDRIGACGNSIYIRCAEIILRTIRKTI